MTGRDRLLRAVLGLAFLLLAPSLGAVLSYRAASRVGAALPLVESRLRSTLALLGAGVVSCEEAGQAAGLPERTLRDAWADLASADHRLGMAAFSVDDEELGLAIDLHLPGTRGLQAAHELTSALSRYVSDLRSEGVPCLAGPEQDALRGEAPATSERRARAWLDEHRSRLVGFTERTAAASRALTRGDAVLTPLTWALGVLEAAGLVCLVVVARQELRRRRAGAGPPAGDAGS